MNHPDQPAPEVKGPSLAERHTKGFVANWTRTCDRYSTDAQALYVQLLPVFAAREASVRVHAALRTRCERLEGALQKIAYRPQENDLPWTVVEELKAIARNAIAQPEDGKCARAPT